MKYVVPLSLLIAGLIHLLPLSGAAGGERLAALYGLSFDDPNLAILMRHRAVLFGLLGAFLVAAAFLPALRPLAFAAGFVSVSSFLWIARTTGAYNEAIGRVVAADWFALACLGIGAATALWLRRGT